MLTRRLEYRPHKVESDLNRVVVKTANNFCQESKKEISLKVSRCCNPSLISQNRNSPGGIRTEAAMCAPEIMAGGAGLAAAAIKARRTKEQNKCSSST